MIMVTDDARGLLDLMLINAQGSAPLDQRYLRIVSRGKVFGLEIDSPRDGDRILQHDGKPLLLISPDLDLALDGATIGARETPEGGKLVLSRPKAA